MVFILVFATVFLLIAVDYFVRREEREEKEEGDKKRSPIFLAPEKALLPLEMTPDRAYHLSHTWVQHAGQESDMVYIGMDEFVPKIMAADVIMRNLPTIGAHLPQGAPLWQIHLGGRYIEQLSPVSGTVADINPACRAGVPLPSEKMELSWIMKIKPDRLEQERYNLMNSEQASLLNTALSDALYLQAQQGPYLNDGGKLDPDFIARMEPSAWSEIIARFFPYQKGGN